MSTRDTSGCSCSTRIRPSAPSAAVLTVWPSSSSLPRTAASTSGLSSITSTRRRREGASRSAGSCRGAAIAGRHTVKRLPPALLSARIVPPCSSSSLRTRGRPRPRPPARRSSGRSPCTNNSKTCGIRAGGDAGPGVLHVDAGLPAAQLHAHVDASTGRRVLQAIDQQVRDDLLEPRGIALHPGRLGAHMQRVAGGRALDVERAAHARDQLGQVDRLQGERDASGDHAADVEQVVQQVRQVACLAAQDRARFGGFGTARRRRFEHVEGGRDRADRIAQLVPEHGQELVLRPGRGLRLVVRRPGRLACGVQLTQQVLLPGGERGHFRAQAIDLGLRGVRVRTGCCIVRRRSLLEGRRGHAATGRAATNCFAFSPGLLQGLPQPGWTRRRTRKIYRKPNTQGRALPNLACRRRPRCP